MTPDLDQWVTWSTVPHGTHVWLPVGHITLPQWDSSKAGTTKSGNHILPDRLPDKFYIIRACSECTGVWWQEYIPEGLVP